MCLKTCHDRPIGVAKVSAGVLRQQIEKLAYHGDYIVLDLKPCRAKEIYSYKQPVVLQISIDGREERLKIGCVVDRVTDKYDIKLFGERGGRVEVEIEEVCRDGGEYTPEMGDGVRPKLLVILKPEQSANWPCKIAE